MSGGFGRSAKSGELQCRGCDIGRTTYAKYEAGELNIRISVLIELKKIYRCAYDDFLQGWTMRNIEKRCKKSAAVQKHGGTAVYSFGSLTASTSPLARPASPCSSDGMMIFVALPSAIFCMASSALSLMT